MPDANCVFPECTVSITPKYHGMGIFQIPMRDHDFHFNWGNNIVAGLGRYRVMGKAVKERILTGKICIYERHFKTGYIEFTNT